MYGLKHQSRCVTAQLAQQEKHRFLVGTRHPREENEVHLIEFEENDNEIINIGVYKHPHEVWYLATSPMHEDIFMSCYHTGESFQSSLWRMTETSAEDNKEDEQPQEQFTAEDLEAMMASGPSANVTVFQGEVKLLEKITDLKQHTGLTRVVWHPVEGYGAQMISMDSSHLRHFNLGKHDAKCTDTPLYEYKVQGLTAGCWDPHHGGHFVAAAGCDILVFDLRQRRGGLKSRIQNAHEATIKDVDYNPNKPYHIVTGGDDRQIRIWDLRSPEAALLVLSSHSHWVHSVKYNRFHDQLLLSAGSDSTVNLWSVVSRSSAPLGDLEDPQNEKEGDRLVQSYKEHDDSVYSIAWSCYDAWIFASISNDGRVVVSHVPPAEKYKILL